MRLQSLIATFLITLSVASVFAQDIIYKTDGEKIEADVIEISDIEIKFKKSSNPEGPLYIISRNEVLIIIYNNGDHEVFEGKRALQEEQHQEYGNNIVSLSFFDIVFNRVMVYYESISSSGMIGYKIPFAIGEYDNEISVITGIDINFYPSGQGKAKHFIGPKIRVGQMNDRLIQDERFVAIMINNGVSIQSTHDLNISFSGALGAIRLLDDDEIQPWGSLTFTFGYRF